MIQNWCPKCHKASAHCLSSELHKRDFLWRTDFRLGGRWGERVRECFPTKELARAFESQQVTDFQRGVLIPRESQSKILFEELADRYYTEHCLVNCRKSQLHTKYMVEKVKEHLGKIPADRISRKDIKEMRVTLLAEGLSAAYVNRLTHGVVGPIFSWAVEEELIRSNPCRDLSRLPIEEPSPRFLTREEIEHVYKFFKSQRLKDYADVLYHTGARPSSIKDCSWDSGDVDMENRRIWFTTYKGRRNSVKKFRYSVPMDPTVEAIVRRRGMETGRKGQVFDTNGVDKEARQAIKESKINEGKTTPFTIYGLKHCYASHLLMNGADLFAVSKLLGHTDTKMVEKHYGHLTQDYLRTEQAKLTKLEVLTPAEKTA